MLRIRRLDSTEQGFARALAALAAWEDGADAAVEETVRAIIEDVRARGDAALVEHTNRLDHRQAAGVAELAVDPARLAAAHAGLAGHTRAALEHAAARIRAYHEREVERSWSFEDEHGNLLGQQVTSLERVGVYVPGGQAAYPSSVLMNVLPARVAGVDEVVMVVPAPGGELDTLVSAAAHVAGVDRVFTVGGAQAVAALAYGTESVPQVDKIVGPGNVYVATAKRLVYGVVGIEMIAGPSEVVVVSDGSSRPEWIAMDLFAQAEHDRDARAILVCTDAGFVERVAREMERLLPDLGRRDIVRAALEGRGALVTVRDLEEAVAVVNRLAPEHLELAVAEPEVLARCVRHAGAIFLGHHSAEVMGDYCAGPNHVLPTARTARFSSPLGVYDFQKRSSLIRCSVEGARRLADTAATLARCEGLDAHARAAELRRDEPDPS